MMTSTKRSDAMQITTCPVCGQRICWEPALDAEPKCGRCGWDAEDKTVRLSHLEIEELRAMLTGHGVTVDEFVKLVRKDRD